MPDGLLNDAQEAAKLDALRSQVLSIANSSSSARLTEQQEDVN
jgi:glutathione peroxidase-family protein